MNSYIRNLLCASVAIAPLAMIGAPAMAADQPSAAGVDVVVVTAQKRSENIQDVPIAITAISAKALAESNIKDVQDLTTVVSGFAGPGENGMESPHIRGVGSEVGEAGLENSVATYVDGIYIGATSPALLRLSDVTQVEVLKGPQGTLFGRNTTGGLIQIQTRDPGPAPEADLEVGYANYNTVSGAAYFNLPINPNVSTNLAIQATGAGQGWGTNLLLGTPTYKLDLDMAIRNKWNIRLNDSTTFQFIVDYEHRNDEGFFDHRPPLGTIDQFGNPAVATGWNTYDNVDERAMTDAFGVAGRFSHDFGFATLTNTLAYRSTIFDQAPFDGDGGPTQVFDVYWYNANHQWTDELQLSSKAGQRLQWTTGFFYYNAADITNQPTVFGPQAPGPPLTAPAGAVATTAGTVGTASYAGYAQASYKIFPNTTLTGGLRYTYDQHSLSGVTTFVLGGPPNITLNSAASAHQSLVYRLSLEQRFSDDAMVYVSYNRGDKAGGYNPLVNANAQYKDEQLDAYEAGTKLTFFDKRVRLNLAGFYYNYANIQVDLFPPGAPPIIYNGPSATLYGLDADFEVRPTSALTITGNFEVLHSAFGSFPGAQEELPCTLATPGCLGNGWGYYTQTFNAKGNALPLAPDFTASLAVDYTIPTNYGKWDLAGTYTYNDGYYTSPGLEIKQRAFSLLGASVQFSAPDERYYVRVWGKNLTNTQYSDILNISTANVFLALNAPRTFGVTLGAKFK